MKKSLSKSQLRTSETPQSKAPLGSSNYSSQQKQQQLTDSSLVQIGSDTYSTNKKTHSTNSNSSMKQMGIQQQIQNTQINEENYYQKEKQLKSIIKQICNPNANLKESNPEYIQNLNIPQLTFVSAGKSSVSQKKKSGIPSTMSNNDSIKINRANSIEKQSVQAKNQLQNQKQVMISNFDDNDKRYSFTRLESQPTSTEKKKKSKGSASNSMLNSQNQNSTNPYQSINQQRRQSVYDLNEAKSKYASLNSQQQQQYFTTNMSHLGCIMPQKVESKTSSLSQIPQFDRGESTRSGKKSPSKLYDNPNSANSQSPSQTKLPQTGVTDPSQSAKNSQVSKSVDRKLQNGVSSSTTHSQHSNGGGHFHQNNSIYNSQNQMAQYQYAQQMNQQPPFLSQTTSYYSNNNNRETQQFIMNEQLVNNLEKHSDILKEELEKAHNKIKELDKQNSDVLENYEQLEKENGQLRRILTEQEQVMSRMKDLYSSIGNEDSKYRSNNPNDNYSSNHSVSASNYNELKESYGKLEFENNQLKLKNQEYSIRIKVLQENIRDLEFKNKEIQQDVNNFILQKTQLEQEILQSHENFMKQQQIIHELTEELQNNRSDPVMQDIAEDEQVKKAARNKGRNSEATNFIFTDEQQIQEEPYQIIPSLPKNPSQIITVLDNGFDSKKFEQENQSLLFKIEDLESQLHQVYKSLNSSPSKSTHNLDLLPDSKLFLLATNSQAFPQGFVESQQIQNGSLFTIEQVKQLILDTENLKNTVKEQKNQVILWSERYHNLEIVHQALLAEKSSHGYEPIQMINTEENNKEQLKEHIQNLSRQIEDMTILMKDQNTEITFLKMKIQQSNIEIQDYQIKLESKEATYQMIKKRIQDLEEYNISLSSQKGQFKVQINQLQELFDNQKSELNNLYQLLKTRNLDSDIIQKQLDEIQSTSRKQQITMQTYEKEMDELVSKNSKLQNQIYDMIHQNAQSNTANYLLNQQKDIVNQTLLQSLSMKPQSNYDLNLMSTIQQNGYSSPVNLKFNGPMTNSTEFPQPQNAISQPQTRNSFENPTFGNLNTGKNLSTDNQLSKELSSLQNQLSFQNQNTSNPYQANSQLPPLYSNPQLNNRISNISDFELTKSKIDENLITQMSNAHEKSVYMSQ